MSVVQPYKFTVEDFERMGRAGVFDEGERVELLDGQIVEMTPIGHPHAGTVAFLNKLLVPAVGDRALLWPQNPVVLSELSMPQPDVVLVKPRPDDYRATGHPRPEDVLLLIEVADSSARLDRTIKATLYARAGIGEYWIVDLRQRAVQVLRHPEGDAYRSVEEHSEGRLAPDAFPDVVLDVADILGPEPESKPPRSS